MPSRTPGRRCSAWTFASTTSKRSFLSSPARRSAKDPSGERGRNEPARRRRKSLRETYERLPREDNDVLRACVPDNPDTCFRHDLHGPGQRELPPLRAGPRPVEIFRRVDPGPRSRREVQNNPGRPCRQRHAVRQGQQGEPCPGYSERLWIVTHAEENLQ